MICSCRIMESFEILCGIAAVLLAVYYYFTSTFDFWKSRGIRGPQPIPIFGNFKDVMLNKKATGDYLMEIYNKYKDESMIGIFARKTPVLIVKNPEFIKDILIKDFIKFADRGIPISEKVDPLSQHLFALESKRWRPLRVKLSPAFTSGKLKEMFSLISECAEHLEQYIEKLVLSEARCFRSRTLRSPKGIYTNSYSPNGVVMAVLQMTESLIASQAFVFFLAGFETSSTTMSNTLYELALNQEIQDKLREEIDEEYTKHGSNLTYENVKKMNYLDKVFKETLRKYPPATFLMRQSTSSYTFDGITLNIPKDQKVWIPVFAIHRDPDIYPKPDVFDPERFTDEAVQARHAMHYLPFGDGPRNCIGARFAVYQTKIGLIRILRNYKVETCDKTQIPYVIDPKAFLLAPKGGIYLKIIKINQA
ncbi:cytochrome P450 6B1-like [Formica exsecta]|uniref:cytochrome P450 6B1-like n=1 Tax=Formica exsecta TaxID=72781 RepID=UPI0011443122|nr:cytochrome P450 6B1-like [Formica exsecta]